MSVHSTNLGVQELLEIATPTIASSYALSRAVTIPIICSSGLTDVTAPLALAAGAKGVGIGSMVSIQFIYFSFTHSLAHSNRLIN